MSKKYQRFGLRRENNLSDTINPEIALGNILNNLAAEGEVFQPADLYTSIKGLNDTDVRTVDLTDLADSQVIYYGEDRIPRIASPLITIKDQIDNYKLISGDPPFLTGGSGPNAYFIQSDDVQPADSTSTGADLYANTAVEFGAYSFWTNGIFSLPNHVFEEFPDSDGMIKWEGLFAPEITLLRNNFNVSSTGLILVEAEIGGNYETILNIYAADREILHTSASTTTAASLNIGTDVMHVGVGDLVTSVNSVDITSSDITVIEVDISTQVITLSDTISVNTGSNTIVVHFDIGQSAITSYFSIDSREIDAKIPIRIYNWWPKPVSGSNTSRDTVFRYVNVSPGYFLPSNHFYTSIPNQDNNLPESVEFFFNNYLQPKKRKTSEEVFIDNQLTINYTPPTQITERRVDAETITSQSGLRITSSGLFTNAEIGDYLYVDHPTGEKIYQINRKLDNNTAILEGNAVTVDTITSLTAYLIRHTGIIGVYDCTANSSIATVTETSTAFPLFDTNGYSLIQNDVLIGNFVSGTYLKRVVNTVNGVGNITIDTADVSAPETITTGPVFVYYDKGLNDRSKLSFCDGVFAREVAVQATGGATQLQLTDVDGSEIGMYVQFDGPILTNTTVTGANTSTNIVTLSQGTNSTIIAGETVTLSPDNVNREVCNIALNTAPPFEGTNRGLITVSGNEGIIVNEIAVENLEMNIATGNISAIVGTTYTQTLDVTSNGLTYKLLIV